MNVDGNCHSCEHECVLVGNAKGAMIAWSSVECCDELPMVIPSTSVCSEVLSLVNQITLVESNLLT